jgi:hypothetical protein
MYITVIKKMADEQSIDWNFPKEKEETVKEYELRRDLACEFGFLEDKESKTRSFLAFIKRYILDHLDKYLTTDLNNIVGEYLFDFSKLTEIVRYSLVRLREVNKENPFLGIRLCLINPDIYTFSPSEKILRKQMISGHFSESKKLLDKKNLRDAVSKIKKNIKNFGSVSTEYIDEFALSLGECFAEKYQIYQDRHNNSYAMYTIMKYQYDFDMKTYGEWLISEEPKEPMEEPVEPRRPEWIVPSVKDMYITDEVIRNHAICIAPCFSYDTLCNGIVFDKIRIEVERKTEIDRENIRNWSLKFEKWQNI